MLPVLLMAQHKKFLAKKVKHKNNTNTNNNNNKNTNNNNPPLHLHQVVLFLGVHTNNEVSLLPRLKRCGYDDIVPRGESVPPTHLPHVDVLRGACHRGVPTEKRLVQRTTLTVLNLQMNECMNEWCLRPQFCIVGKCWDGDK